MPIPFHPLADLFPLIEGKEFDELVGSIKESGQREAIVTFEGQILDGRNRYRACQVAGVEPRIEPFTGADPVRFVIDMNIHRRHLNTSQRAMIAASLAQMRVGRPTAENGIAGIPAISMPAPVAAELMNVNKQTVFDAKRVLREGTADQIKAVKEGKAGVTMIARGLRSKARAANPKPLSISGKNPQRIETMRMNAQIWAQLRDALINLTSLPRPADVVAIARANDKVGAVDHRLINSLNWLTEFADAWTAASRGQDTAA